MADGSNPSVTKNTSLAPVVLAPPPPPGTVISLDSLRAFLRGDIDAEVARDGFRLSRRPGARGLGYGCAAFFWFAARTERDCRDFLPLVLM